MRIRIAKAYLHETKYASGKGDGSEWMCAFCARCHYNNSTKNEAHNEATQKKHVHSHTDLSSVRELLKKWKSNVSASVPADGFQCSANVLRRCQCFKHIHCSSRSSHTLCQTNAGTFIESICPQDHNLEFFIFISFMVLVDRYLFAGIPPYRNPNFIFGEYYFMKARNNVANAHDQSSATGAFCCIRDCWFYAYMWLYSDEVDACECHLCVRIPFEAYFTPYYDTFLTVNFHLPHIRRTHYQSVVHTTSTAYPQTHPRLA